ncbi:hypothetical protein WJX81_007312 [Elliptochloris bilobata]|uniref:protein-tyrosine-phosphatase n=1 Tax=Elliptochloris bilobata TaxID=381761 RepID=A0AAW1RRY6_9CHLO
MDVSQCITLLGPGLDSPVDSSGRPTEVRPGLFLGGVMALPFLRELRVTHVLSILNMYVADLLEQQGAFKRLEIWLPDHPAADILRHLPVAVAFVREALASGGRVLVHCAAGISRSATVVTAFLMKTEVLSAEAARAALARVHPQAWPNEGFRAALELWGEAGCSEQANTPALRRRRMEALGRQWAEMEASGSQWSDEGAIAAALLPSPDEEPALDAVLYRCRTCRRIVASSANAIPVERGDGTFRNKRGGQPQRGLEAAETSLFVEPLRWMTDALQLGKDRVVSGKLSCPGCGARLGARRCLPQ